MVQMMPRKPLVPNPNQQRSRQNEFTSGRHAVSNESPSILSYNGHGRGVQGEHSNGGRNSALETGRAVYALNKPWKK